MSFFKTSWKVAGWWALAYVWLDALWESGSQVAEAITDNVDAIASETLNILSGIWLPEIGSLAPISQKFIAELSWVLSDTSLLDAGMSWWLWLIAWLAGKAGSHISGKVIWVESETDNKVASVGIWSATALWLLWAWATAVTIWAGTTGYVLGRKLGERILWEKYANITWTIWSLSATWLAWWASSGAILWATAVAGWAMLMWNARKS